MVDSSTRAIYLPEKDTYDQQLLPTGKPLGGYDRNLAHVGPRPSIARHVHPCQVISRHVGLGQKKSPPAYTFSYVHAPFTRESPKSPPSLPPPPPPNILGATPCSRPPPLCQAMFKATRAMALCHVTHQKAPRLRAVRGAPEPGGRRPHQDEGFPKRKELGRDSFGEALEGKPKGNPQPFQWCRPPRLGHVSFWHSGIFSPCNVSLARANPIAGEEDCA